jgi:hypothetical protein
MQEPEHAKFIAWAKVSWRYTYTQIMAKQREEWLRREAESRQAPAAHPAGCACWDCVLALYGAAAKHRAVLDQRARAKDEAF